LTVSRVDVGRETAKEGDLTGSINERRRRFPRFALLELEEVRTTSDALEGAVPCAGSLGDVARRRGGVRRAFLLD
jgi:hypothetical protein